MSRVAPRWGVVKPAAVLDGPTVVLERLAGAALPRRPGFGIESRDGMHQARRTHRALLCLAFVHGLGCVPDVDVALPAIAPGAASAIMLFEPLEHPGVRGFALDLGGRVDEPFAVPARTRITVLQHARTLRELDLVAGPLPSADTAEHRRGLPPSLVRHRAELDGALGAWRVIGTEELPALELPALLAEGCALRDPETGDARGCLDDEGACITPCPGGAEPIEPAAPAAIEVPTAVTCPAGWRPGAPTALGGTFCAPDAPLESVTCPVGQGFVLSEAGCATVGPRCPATAFDAPSADGIPTYYVLPGASGSGTFADPFGSITDALAAVPDGARLVLARGEHDALALAGRRGIELVGTCLDDTIL
ncbi:hypothetical protein L6R52_30985, partial [Myxococcota bacterium]|nr:hypothetical protein [Myxococcota bacterium]